jgi:exodeoxyribonuclease V
MTQLAAQQLAGIDKIKAWYQAGLEAGWWPPFRLFGYAGTGKTTMAKEIPLALGLRNVVYGTYTGKAAHVLRLKGAGPVSTIHSAIYMPTTSAEARLALNEAREQLAGLELRPDVLEGSSIAAERHKELQAALPELEAAARRIGWELNPMSEWSMADLIILDEVSMVGAKLASDVESFQRPILVLGDPAQLPPIEGGGYYTDATPDHLLTDIHRQALEHPITALATRVRESTTSSLGLTRADRVGVSVRQAMEHDQVLVWSNKRRWSLLHAIREAKGYPRGVPVPGDRIMCLTNNKDMAVFNGQQFEVLDARPGTIGPTLELVTEEGQHRTINAFSDGFQGLEGQAAAKKSGAGQRGNRMLATFAQAITVHKAQGSEWDSVYVFDQTAEMMSSVSRREGSSRAAEQARQWMYTAATRARERLTLASLGA